MPNSTAMPKRAKPDSRRDAILEAAAEVFLHEGYERACIDDIIAKVGGSKRTIYSEFGSKENLFAEIIKLVTTRAVATLPEPDVAKKDVRAALVEFGVGFLQLLMAAQTLAVFRVVFGECRKFPKLGKFFYDGGPGQSRAHLERILAEYEKRGDLKLADRALAADAFVSMIRGNHHMQVALGLRPPLTSKEIRRIVEAKVDIFLGGTGKRD